MEAKKRYEEWIENPYFDEATKSELKSIACDEKEIEERFAREKARREKMYAEQEKLHEMRKKWLEDMEKVLYKGNEEKDGEP